MATNNSTAAKYIVAACCEVVAGVSEWPSEAPELHRKAEAHPYNFFHIVAMATRYKVWAFQALMFPRFNIFVAMWHAWLSH